VFSINIFHWIIFIHQSLVTRLASFSILDMFADSNEIWHSEVKCVIWRVVQLISTRASWYRKHIVSHFTYYYYLCSSLLRNTKWNKGNESSLNERFLKCWLYNRNLRPLTLHFSMFHWKKLTIILSVLCNEYSILNWRDYLLNLLRVNYSCIYIYLFINNSCVSWIYVRLILY